MEKYTEANNLLNNAISLLDQYLPKFSTVYCNVMLTKLQLLVMEGNDRLVKLIAEDLLSTMNSNNYNNITFYSNLATTLASGDSPEQAITAYETVNDDYLDPYSLLHKYSHIGQIYYMWLHDEEKAIEYFTKVLMLSEEFEISPFNRYAIGAKLYLMIIYEGMNNYAAALLICEEIIRSGDIPFDSEKILENMAINESFVLNKEMFGNKDVDFLNQMSLHNFIYRLYVESGKPEVDFENWWLNLEKEAEKVQ